MFLDHLPSNAEDYTIHQHLGAIMSQINRLSLDVNTIKLKPEQATTTTVTSTHTHSEESNFWGSGDITCLIKHSRSLARITEIVPHMEIHNEGVHCKLCNATLAYNSDFGVSFEKVHNLPTSFKNLRISVVRHLESKTHKIAVDKVVQADKSHEVYLSIGKKAALNCAGHAYTGYYFSAPNVMYEYTIADTFNAGGEVGTKCHSSNFPTLFLPHMYSALKDHIVDNVIHDNLPFGIMADKVTISHRTRHMVGIRLPVFDLDYPSLTKDIYVQSASVKHHDGLSLSNHLLDSIEAMGIPRFYIRSHLSGSAFDGQYTKLNVGDHLSEILDSPTSISWDPMHVLQLSFKDSQEASFINSTIELITCVVKAYKWGQGYEALLDNKDLCDHFYTPKLFKGMKFVAYSDEVFKSFISNYKCYVATSEQFEDATLRDKLMALPFVTHLTFLSDVCWQLSMCSKSVQVSDKLPWKFPVALDQFKSTLTSMLNQLKSLNQAITKEGVQSIPSGILSKDLFPNFHAINDIYNSNVFKDVPLPHKPLENIRQTRSYIKEYCVDLSGVTDKNVKLLASSIIKFTEYITVLHDNVCNRFTSKTFDACSSLGRLMDLDFLFYPVLDYKSNPYDIETSKSFYEIVNSLPYKDKVTCDSLYFEYTEFLRYAASEAEVLRSKSRIETICTPYLLKKFVSERGDQLPQVTKLLSFSICFPVSEAIVESWGSSLDAVYHKKHHTYDPVDDLKQTGTVDMLVFLRLNGPRPSMKSNISLLKTALIGMKGSDYGKYFQHSLDHNLNATSKVVTRVLNPNPEHVLPWWRNE